MTETKLVMVYNANSEIEAQLIKGKLASRGIPAMIKNPDLVMMGTAGEYQVLVPQGWEQEARAALHNANPTGLEP